MTQTEINYRRKDLNDMISSRCAELLDVWNKKMTPSKSIVREVERAIANKKQRNTLRNRIEAFAYLCALEQRIKVRYRSAFKRIIFYFAWKRETVALRSMCFSLNIPTDAPVRDAIEYELEKLCELDLDEIIDDEDETDGGKTNGMEVEASEAKSAGISEEKTEEVGSREEELQNEADAEEKTEDEVVRDEKTEKVEKSAEDIQELKEEAVEEIGEQRSDEKTVENTAKEQSEDVIGIDLPEEGGKADEKANDSQRDPLADDVPPPSDFREEKKPEEKLNFIDEVIMDNMARGIKDPIRHNPLSDLKQPAADQKAQDIANSAKEQQGRDKGSEAHLYDRMVNGEREQSSSGAHERTSETKADSPKTAEAKSTSTNKTDNSRQAINIDQNNSVGEVKNVADNPMNLSTSEENKLRMNISEMISSNETMLEAYKVAQEEALKQLMDGDGEKIQISVFEAADSSSQSSSHVVNEKNSASASREINK